MTLFVTADLHFNHRGILKHCAVSRPYADIHEMNQGIIESWNRVVRPNDEVVVLGDFGFAMNDGDDLGEIFDALHGTKSLVIGNHDKNKRNAKVVLDQLPWDRQDVMRSLRFNKRKAVTCHYPLLTWDGAHRGAIMLHGHSHGTMTVHDPHRFDVGWDIYTRPIPIEAFFEAADASGPYTPVDHHGSED